LSLRSRLFGRRRAEWERPESVRSDAGYPHLRRSAPISVAEEEALELGPEESRYPIGEHAWLVVDKPLTPLQQKRLQQVVMLLRSILEEDD
jgi:hypothetical protein